MEVSGQLHAPVALLPGKDPLVPIGKEAGWTPEQWSIVKSLVPAGNQTLAVQPVARRYTD
jgi:hypothetical protein